jgi:coniferyl-aldehyde dehydrogenase
MNDAPGATHEAPVDTATADLAACLHAQRQAYLADPYPNLEQRRQDLQALKSLLSDNREAMAEAIAEDYTCRSRHETMLAEVIMVLDGIHFASKNLNKWMRAQRRGIDRLIYPGAKNRVIPQPLGVVGVIVPWNFPIQLSLGPLVCIFAAGNRAMVKMSENSRHLSRLLIQLAPGYFPPEKLSIFEETGGVGIQFSQQPFDHLMFTGSTETGRAVMASAAKNLTPVTLELGGKSPAVIAPDYPLKKAVERIMATKIFNAGQICVDVDYLFIPEDRVTGFVELARAWVKSHCPDINSRDYTSIINQAAFDRLNESLADAKAKGATLINLAEGQESKPGQRKMAPHLVLGTSGDMVLMQREIFGPILPIIPYRDRQEVVDHVTARDRPLAFYPFTNEKSLQDFYLQRIMSGGSCVNDATLHVVQHDMPFGGIGASGMGQYHGYEGFLNFSKLRPVFYQAGFSGMKFLAPPYGKFADLVLKYLIKNKS